MREITEIAGYHAHVYFDLVQRDAAERLREAIAGQFTAEVGRVHEKAIGPHPKPMYQVAFAPDEFAKIVPWLMLNRTGLSILVHPRTGDEPADHDVNPLWLGEHLPIDIEFLRKHGG
jgi:aromatic ring-cleaving dioxygenase